MRLGSGCLYDIEAGNCHPMPTPVAPLSTVSVRESPRQFTQFHQRTSLQIQRSQYDRLWQRDSELATISRGPGQEWPRGGQRLRQLLGSPVQPFVTRRSPRATFPRSHTQYISSTTLPCANLELNDTTQRPISRWWRRRRPPRNLELALRHAARCHPSAQIARRPPGSAHPTPSDAVRRAAVEREAGTRGPTALDLARRSRRCVV